MIGFALVGIYISLQGLAWAAFGTALLIAVMFIPALLEWMGEKITGKESWSRKRRRWKNPYE